MREHPRTPLVLHPWLQAASQAGPPLSTPAARPPCRQGKCCRRRGGGGVGEVSEMFGISTNVDRILMS